MQPKEGTKAKYRVVCSPPPFGFPQSSLSSLSPFVCELCWKLNLYLPSPLGSSLTATGTGCPWRGSRKGGVGGSGGAREEIVTSEKERGFDIEGGAIGFRLGRMRGVGQRGLFVQVQGVGFGFGVRVHIELLRGRAKGVKEGGRTVASAASGSGRPWRHRLGAGGHGTHTREGCSGVDLMVRKGVGRAGGGTGGGRGIGVRWGKPLLFRGGIYVTGVRPVGGGII